MTRPITDLQRTVAPFEVISEFVPAGDQPAAIAEIAHPVSEHKNILVPLSLVVRDTTAAI